MTPEKKRKLLLLYAEKFPINDLPGFTNVMSVDSKYIRVSDNALSLIGYKDQDQIFETDYADMPCQAAESAEKFKKEDQLALSQEIKILSYHHFNDNWNILLGHKKPIIQEGEAIGTLANFIDITQSNIIDLSRFLFQNNRKIKKKQFSYIIQNTSEFHGLTKKEQECLFFFIRGHTYGEISKILQIAITTVQTHIEHIKQKFNVKTRSQLIEKAVHLGFLGIIPESLFK